jgi:hypothetical protein
MNAYAAKAVNEHVSRRGRSGAGGFARRRSRLSVRLRAAKLDRALSAGAPAHASPALALRAEALRSPRTRRVLRDALEALLTPRSEGRLPGSRVSPARGRVNGARDELAELARRLRPGQPVEARGIARVRELLSDGGGPLFWSRSEEDLGAAVRKAIAALGPSPDQRRARETR